MKIKIENKKIEKMKKNIIQKKTSQNYHGSWVPNLINFFIQKEKKHKITMAHECQI